jgi:hypothetical protein
MNEPYRDRMQLVAVVRSLRSAFLRATAMKGPNAWHQSVILFPFPEHLEHIMKIIPSVSQISVHVNMNQRDTRPLKDQCAGMDSILLFFQTAELQEDKDMTDRAVLARLIRKHIEADSPDMHQTSLSSREQEQQDLAILKPFEPRLVFRNQEYTVLLLVHSPRTNSARPSI